MKVALVYDRLNSWGGAERVLLLLKELFPNVVLYSSIYNRNRAKWVKDFKIHTSFLQTLPYAKTHHELFAPLMPIAFESFTFDEYDLVISVTSEAAKGIITKPKTLHICYCLTPTRYLWSGYNEYFKDELPRILSKPVVSYLRTWDRLAAKRPDAFIAISKEVKKRITRYYQRDSEVVYPPLLLEECETTKKSTEKTKEPFFLVVSRLIEFKRIDIVIEACNTLQIPLKIVGTGPYGQKLRSMSGSTIEFLGSLTDRDLIEYYKDSLALISPAWEDFGLSCIEAQSFGKPVIAYGRGGALETVVSLKTGLFFDKQETRSLIEAIKLFQKSSFNSLDCKKNAEKFNKEEFKKTFLKTIENFIAKKRI